jgi:signal peptidase
MKILKIIYSVFVAFIVLVAVLLIVSVLPITENFRILTVISGSMEPAIKVGSVVVVKPAADYNVGDVVTFGKFGRNSNPITHRITEVILSESGGKLFRTKGDANNGPDQDSISKDKILGKVLFSIPYLGYAVDFAKKPLGFSLIIMVPAAAIIADEIKKIITELKNKKANDNIQG